MHDVPAEIEATHTYEADSDWDLWFNNMVYTQPHVQDDVDEAAGNHVNEFGTAKLCAYREVGVDSRNVSDHNALAKQAEQQLVAHDCVNLVHSEEG